MAALCWRQDGRGCWVGRVGERGRRVKVLQRLPGHVYYLAVWQPRVGYRLASHRTRDRREAERLALLAYAAREGGSPGGWGAALRAVQHREVVPRDAATASALGGLSLGALWHRFSTTAGMYLDNGPRARADTQFRVAVLVGYFGADCPVGGLDEDAQHRYAAARRRGGIRYLAADRRIAVTRPTGPRSPEADLACLRAMLAWATRAREADGRPLLEGNPLAGARRPRGPVDRRRPVATHERFEATLASMRHLRAKAATPAAERRWLRMELALILAEATGRRLGAIGLLRWEDIDWDGRSLTWRAEADKRQREWDTPIPAALFCALREYAVALTGRAGGLDALEGQVFAAEKVPNGVIDRHLFDHWLRVAERAAGLPKLKGGLWHPYRRKWAVERKHHPLGDVAAAGGWRDVPTLVSCYSLPDVDTMRRVMSEPVRLRSLAEPSALKARVEPRGPSPHAGGGARR